MSVDTADENENYIEQLIKTNDELEMTIQMQNDETEKLRTEIDKLKAKLAQARKDKAKVLAKGRMLCDLVDELAGAGFLVDEHLDNANKAIDAWVKATNPNG
jgi:multidrug resistance efflux pump